VKTLIVITVCEAESRNSSGIMAPRLVSYARGKFVRFGEGRVFYFHFFPHRAHTGSGSLPILIPNLYQGLFHQG